MKRRLNLRKLSSQEIQQLVYLYKVLHIYNAYLILCAVRMQKEIGAIDIVELAIDLDRDESTVRRAINRVNLFGPTGLRVIGRPKKRYI